RTIARRLAESARTMPQLTADMQVDLGNLLAARSRLNAAEQAAGRASVSVLSFVAAAVCRLLPQHAELNATYADTHMLLWRVVNLGVAVDTPEGLVVPVLRDAGRLSLPELNAAITALASRARAGELRAEELEGGTFTISNPGSLGPVLRAQAILNPPQVALLGLPGMRRAPVAIDDGSGGYCVEVRPLLCPSLTFDHRALDGGQVIRFLNALKEELECRPG
ncbi:MAG: 2-oxo acid dehydrogenase subunit E2, partial [Pseudomonadales bacterium]